jgi:hypothetical protein
MRIPKKQYPTMTMDGVGSGRLLSIGATEAAILPTQKLRVKLVARRLTSTLELVIIT